MCRPVRSFLLAFNESVQTSNLSHFVSSQFVADGLFKAELNEFLTRELAEDGYSGVEVSPSSMLHIGFVVRNNSFFLVSSYDSVYN